jgi:hypothetical protein
VYRCQTASDKKAAGHTLDGPHGLHLCPDGRARHHHAAERLHAQQGAVSGNDGRTGQLAAHKRLQLNRGGRDAGCAMTRHARAQHTLDGEGGTLLHCQVRADRVPTPHLLQHKRRVCPLLQAPAQKPVASGPLQCNHAVKHPAAQAACMEAPHARLQPRDQLPRARLTGQHAPRTAL